MENFRRYRPQSNKTRSTDGFIRTDRSRHIGPAPKLKRGDAYQSARSRIGNFSSSDGFHPAGPTRRLIGEVPKPHSRRPERDTSGKIQLDTSPSEKMKKQKRFRLFNPFKRSNWNKKMVMKTAGVFGVIVLLMGSYLGIMTWLNARRIFQGGGGAAALQENVDPSLLRGEGDGRVNILLLGRGGEGHEGADLTDTIMIASINPIQNEAALLSIPRDLYVQTSGGGYTKINAVFANAKSQALATSSSTDSKTRTKKAEAAGMKAIEDVIQSKIGIPMHYHAIIDFEGFYKAVNTVGGVTINITEENSVYEQMRIFGQNYTLNVKAGRQHFNGIRALAYTRSRYTSNRGDFSRSERQRLMIVALKSKILSAGTYSNPLRVARLMGNFGDNIKTNLGVGEVRRLYDIGKKIDSKKITSVGLADPPNDYLTTSMVNGLSVVIPKAGLDSYKEIQHFVRNRLRDGFLAQENASIKILNGTSTAGLAGETSADLKSYGYRVTKVGNAPTKAYQKTVVVAMRGGGKKYTKRYLENRFGTKVATRLPDPKIKPGTADFVIILGQNEQTRLAN